jgi:transcriptional regulator with XRE-family HTH domain
MIASEKEWKRRQTVLRALMAAHQMTRADVAIMLGVSFDTVKAWLKAPTSRSARRIPEARLELLRLKLP